MAIAAKEAAMKVMIMYSAIETGGQVSDFRESRSDC